MPSLDLDRLENKNFQKTKHKNNINMSKSKWYIVIPHVYGQCKCIKNICIRYGILTYLKGNRTIKNILVSPKDMDPIQYKSVIIYWYKCNRLDCDDEYIGESARTFVGMYKEHVRAPH